MCTTCITCIVTANKKLPCARHFSYFLLAMTSDFRPGLSLYTPPPHLFKFWTACRATPQKYDVMEWWLLEVRQTIKLNIYGILQSHISMLMDAASRVYKNCNSEAKCVKSLKFENYSGEMLLVCSKKWSRYTYSSKLAYCFSHCLCRPIVYCNSSKANLN